MLRIQSPEGTRRIQVSPSNLTKELYEMVMCNNDLFVSQIYSFIIILSFQFRHLKLLAWKIILSYYTVNETSLMKSSLPKAKLLPNMDSIMEI